MSLPDFSTLNKNNIVAFLGDIFNRRGAEEYLGENVTMSEHMLQAAQLAEQADAGDRLIAGALLHDIGHFRESHRTIIGNARHDLLVIDA